MLEKEGGRKEDRGRTREGGKEGRREGRREVGGGRRGREGGDCKVFSHQFRVCLVNH